MSTTVKALPNACPTCLQEAGRRCVSTITGKPTNAHAARVRGEWPKIVCSRTSYASERVGGACPLCGHTNLVHPQPFANPALKQCVICQVVNR